MFNQQPFRLAPNGMPQDYKTYQISAPRSTHWRSATCEEVSCTYFLNGWKTVVPVDSPQAQYIRTTSGRHFKETKQAAGLTEFDFSPGQTCFASDKHKVRLDRQEKYLVRPGDWRTPRTRPYVHTRASDWVEDFA